jgi:hypothetical protein
MTWHIPDTVEDREIRNSLISQTLHEPVTRARGGHSDASEAHVSH